MSRTIRREKAKPHKFVTHIWAMIGPSWEDGFEFVEREDSVRKLAQFYSDSGSHWYYGQEMNPGKWAKRFWQKVYRQDSKNQLRKFTLDEEFEVQIRNKPRYPRYD